MPQNIQKASFQQDFGSVLKGCFRMNKFRKLRTRPKDLGSARSRLLFSIRSAQLFFFDSQLLQRGKIPEGCRQRSQAVPSKDQPLRRSPKESGSAHSSSLPRSLSVRKDCGNMLRPVSTRSSKNKPSSSSPKDSGSLRKWHMFFDSQHTSKRRRLQKDSGSVVSLLSRMVMSYNGRRALSEGLRQIGQAVFGERASSFLR